MQPHLGLNESGRDMFNTCWKYLVALTCVLSFGAVNTLLADELTVADYREIQALYGKYAAALDSGDGDSYASTYTEDGVFRLDRNGVAGTPTIGHGNLVTFAERYLCGQPRPRASLE